MPHGLSHPASSTPLRAGGGNHGNPPVGSVVARPREISMARRLGLVVAAEVIGYQPPARESSLRRIAGTDYASIRPPIIVADNCPALASRLVP